MLYELNSNSWTLTYVQHPVPDNAGSNVNTHIDPCTQTDRAVLLPFVFLKKKPPSYSFPKQLLKQA